jgi:hypothetical protein
MLTCGGAATCAVDERGRWEAWSVYRGCVMVRIRVSERLRIFVYRTECSECVDDEVFRKRGVPGRWGGVPPGRAWRREPS